MLSTENSEQHRAAGAARLLALGDFRFTAAGFVGVIVVSRAGFVIVGIVIFTAGTIRAAET